MFLCGLWKCVFQCVINFLFGHSYSFPWLLRAVIIASLIGCGLAVISHVGYVSVVRYRMPIVVGQAHLNLIHHLLLSLREIICVLLAFLGGLSIFCTLYEWVGGTFHKSLNIIVLLLLSSLPYWSFRQPTKWINSQIQCPGPPRYNLAFRWTYLLCIPKWLTGSLLVDNVQRSGLCLRLSHSK